MRYAGFVLITALTAITPTAADAVDGVILIDQNKAMTGGVTPGDTPGFPVSITQPGSYRLVTNLVIADPNTNAIEISANHVTIDLNGFAIMGPADCSSGFPCANTAASSVRGHGVEAGSDAPAKTYYDISVRGGTITGMGADGVHLLGDAMRVEELRVRGNGLSGIVIRGTGIAGLATNSIVRGNNVQLNGSYGIKTEGAMVADNVVTECRDIGIRVDFGPGVASRNVVGNCGSLGLQLGANVPYTGNALQGNNGGGIQVSGGINTGQNTCGTAVCPGASF